MKISGIILAFLLICSCTQRDECPYFPDNDIIIGKARDITKKKYPKFDQSLYCVIVEPMGSGWISYFKLKGNKKTVGGTPELLFSESGDFIEIGASQ